MPPKRGASKTKVPKEIPVDTTGDVEALKEKETRPGRASSTARTKTTSPKPEVEIKPKSRGRPKKAGAMVEEAQAPIEKTPVKNARGRKPRIAEEAVPEPVVAEVPKRGRGRKPVVVKAEPEPAVKETKKARSRASSKSPVKRSKSPAKKEARKTSKSPAKKASPAKLASKSPAKKAAEKTVAKKTAISRSKTAVEPEPSEEVAEDVQDAGEPEQMAPVEPGLVVKGKRGRKLKSAEPAKAVEPKPTVGKRGRKPKKVVPPVEDAPQDDAEKMETEAPVEQARALIQEPTPADVESPVVTESKVESKLRGRPKRAPVIPAEPKVSKPRGRPKAVPKTAEQDEEIPEDSLTNLIESAPGEKVAKTVTAKDVSVPEPVVETWKEVKEPQVVKSLEAVKISEVVKEPEVKKLEEPTPVSISATDSEAMEVEEDEASRVNKRKLSDETLVEEVQSKKAKTQVLPVVQLPKIVGRLMTCGTDTTGELGLKVIGFEKRKPVPVDSVQELVCLVAAGAMHTAAVNVGGTKIYTFGCNDELALGRKTAANGTAIPPPQSSETTPTDPDETVVQSEEEVPDAIPTSFRLPNNIVKMTAGDSHTAALTEFGDLYIWGCFRDNRGRIGLIPDGKLRSPIGSPVAVPFETTVVDIASGDNHVIVLTENGTVYTFGCGEQGQLGRVSELFCKIHEDYSNIELFLKPQIVTIDGNLDTKCDRIWAAGFTSFVRTSDGAIYGWGLNNYSQLGFPRRGEVIVEALPRLVPRFCESVETIAGGLHHSLAKDSEGKVYSWGRHLYGRLGHPDVTADVETPRLIESLKNEKVIDIACGNDCSFAVTESGNLYSWGMSAIHLGHSDPRDELEEGITRDVKEPRKVTGKKLVNTSFYAVASGSQHAVFIASSSEQSNGN